MKTKIIIKKGWVVIKEYPFIITMTNKDVVEYEGIEYKVDCCVLELESNIMLILLHN